jgi:hypothetical protein
MNWYYLFRFENFLFSNLIEEKYHQLKVYKSCLSPSISGAQNFLKYNLAPASSIDLISASLN